jgi:hypothetical protein
VIKKEAKKILKYKDLTREIQCMWNVRTNVLMQKYNRFNTANSFMECLPCIFHKIENNDIQQMHFSMFFIYTNTPTCFGPSG